LGDSLDRRKEMVSYRFERAKEEYETSLVLFESKHYRAANNRAYYAIFHAMRAVLAFDGFDSKKHSGIIAAFRKEYIKTGNFDTVLSEIISAASEIRNHSDYDDMFIAEKTETMEQIQNAEVFLENVGQYIEKRLKECES